MRGSRCWDGVGRVSEVRAGDDTHVSVLRETGGYGISFNNELEDTWCWVEESSWFVSISKD